MLRPCRCKLFTKFILQLLHLILDGLKLKKKKIKIQHKKIKKNCKKLISGSLCTTEKDLVEHGLLCFFLFFWPISSQSAVKVFHGYATKVGVVSTK